MGDTSGVWGCSRQFPPVLGIAVLLQVLVTLICSAVMKVSPQDKPESCHGTLLSARVMAAGMVLLILVLLVVLVRLLILGILVILVLGAAPSTAHSSKLSFGLQ